MDLLLYKPDLDLPLLVLHDVRLNAQPEWLGPREVLARAGHTYPGTGHYEHLRMHRPSVWDLDGLIAVAW